MQSWLEKAGKDFNPRLREGGDCFRDADSRGSLQISIHASAREATRTWEREPETAENFNPRLREGGDAFAFVKV